MTSQTDAALQAKLDAALHKVDADMVRKRAQDAAAKADALAREIEALDGELLAFFGPTSDALGAAISIRQAARQLRKIA